MDARNREILCHTIDTFTRTGALLNHSSPFGSTKASIPDLVSGARGFPSNSTCLRLFQKNDRSLQSQETKILLGLHSHLLKYRTLTLPHPDLIGIALRSLL